MPDFGNEITCDKCNVICRSQICFDLHANNIGKNGKTVKSICDTFWRCSNCDTAMKRSQRPPEKHLCGEWKCSLCNEYTNDELHRCYIKPQKVKPPGHKYVFYDFECMQETGVHIPNLCVAHITCAKCINREDVEAPCSCGSRCNKCYKWNKSKNAHKVPPCETCGKRELVFMGPDTLAKFCEWALDPSHHGYTIIAHNQRGYDGMFIQQYLAENHIKASHIYNGSKLLYAKLQNGTGIRLVDSLNFLPMALSKLPKAFGIEGVKKGWFPHFFNTMNNQNYEGPYPNIQHYGADSMMSEEKEKFLQWHATQAGKTFIFKDEILSYCKSDVNILRVACLKFRKLMMDVTKAVTNTSNDAEECPVDVADECDDDADCSNEACDDVDDVNQDMSQGIDPFQQITLAGLCMHVFLSKFYVSEGTPPIGAVPPQGYVKYRQFSKESIQWLEWCSKNEGVAIRHALNHPAGEFKIPQTNYKADGYCAETNTVYLYHGCPWHGCPQCFSGTKHVLTREPASKVYQKTLKQETDIKRLGYRVKTTWSHEFLDMLDRDMNVKKYVNSLDIQDRLDPREAFFGGRTNAIKLTHDADVHNDEEILYQDITSLYPR